MRHNNDYRMLINSKRWRDVRDHKLTLNPLCEICQAEGIVTPARDVHHIIEVESAKSIGEMAALCRLEGLLDRHPYDLSGGEQQRVALARAFVIEPSVLLMDEPTSALDPIATKHIEELLLELQQEVTILIVTHNMGQAKRISSKSMFMYLGELVEYGETETMFTNPVDERTKAYLTGKMG